MTAAVVARPDQRGSRNPAAKLTEDDVREILELLDAGERQHDIAAQFGVSQCIVSKINTGEMWRHVEREGKS